MVSAAHGHPKYTGVSKAQAVSGSNPPENDGQRLMDEYPYQWRVRTRLPERFGQPCRVLVRSKMNSCLVEFTDGAKYVTSRNYVRKRKATDEQRSVRNVDKAAEMPDFDCSPHVVLAFMQNAWARDPVGVECYMQNARPAYRRRVTARMLFMGCLTGKRLQAAFGPYCEDIVWDNASPRIGGAANSRFPADLDHIRATIEDVQPCFILTFGRVAADAVAKVWQGNTIQFPHPASRTLDVKRLPEWGRILRAALEAHRKEAESRDS